jgi:hypothetical protein
MMLVLMGIGALGVLVLLYWLLSSSWSATQPVNYTALPPKTPTGPRPPTTRLSLAERIQNIDTTFSEPVFLEWLSLLYTRYHESRGTGDIGAIAAYLAPAVLRQPPREGGPVADVRGVVIGRVALKGLHQTPSALRVTASFQSNYTAVDAQGREQAYYVHEDWVLERKLGRTSRLPDAVTRLGCPACGAATERTTLGRCTFCQTSTVPGDADFAVVHILVSALERRPPLLTGHVEEVGTDLPNIVSPHLEATLRQWKQRTPPINMNAFTRRARSIFLSLQEGWSTRDWEKLRPYETEPLFQQHRFWMLEYHKQGLQNRLEDITLRSIDMVKASSDAFYDAVTARMHASMRDSTVRVTDGAVIAGNRSVPREFTEYWTFIRTRGAQDTLSDITCPSCIAPLKVNQAGVCAYCQTHLTRGEFDWTLSRIEQDEEYQG